jgi:hypothetical protein
MSTFQLICLLYGGPLLLLFIFGIGFAMWDLLREWWDDRRARGRISELVARDERIRMLEEMFKL